MKTYQVKRADAPGFFDILRSAGYLKHSCTVAVSETATVRASYWDGGSRSWYAHIDAVGGVQDIHVKTRTPFGDPALPWEETRSTKTYPIVSGGTFRGRDAHWMVWIHPDDVERFGLSHIAGPSEGS